MGFVVDLGMAFVDKWAVGKEKGWRERREKKKEEKKKKLNRYQIATIIVLCSFFIPRPVSVCL